MLSSEMAEDLNLARPKDRNSNQRREERFVEFKRCNK